MTSAIPWRRLEREAAAKQRRLLAPFKLAANSAHLLLEDVVRALSGVQRGLCTQVQSRLLTQLSLQLRIVAIAAEAGYPIQALANVATAYELAAAVGFIARDDERARTWLAHVDERNSYPAPQHRKSALRALFIASGAEKEKIEGQVALWENRYRLYCMAKHGNPKLLRRLGAAATADRLRLYHGPIGGGAATTMAQFALLRCAHLLAMSCAFAINGPHTALPEGAKRKLLLRLMRLHAQLRAAAARIQAPATIAA